MNLRLYSDPTAKELKCSIASLYGVNSGMGIQISLHPDNKTIFVLEVHNGSPAMTAGIERGDEIIAVDDKQVSEFGYSETLTYIKNLPSETTIKVKAIRNGEEKEFDVTLKHYIDQSVFYRMIGDKGYIQITGFNDRSPEQFKTAVDTLTEEGATALIIDLRGNGGGTLNAAYKMLDYCIPEGLAIRVKYKDDNMNEVYMSDANEVNLPIVCLTDENTASASELFTQGLKDYNKAVTVGRLTYGKGVVQRTFTLSDGSLVRFTIGEYYTKNGVCLDGIGVKPDVEVTFTDEEMKYRIINGIEKDKDFIAAVEYLENQPS
jgi:carboxyl-terminal processing protease